MLYTYEQAKLKLGERDRIKLENNTYMHRTGLYDIAIRLHNTDVVTIHVGNEYTLDTGGWQTVTTKDRINSYAPIQLFQKNKVWQYNVDGVNFHYYDGMKIDWNGVPLEQHSRALHTFEMMVRKEYSKNA